MDTSERRSGTQRQMSTATVDGDNGLGLVVGPKANRIAIAKAEQAGSGWVSVRNTNHFGIAGYYVLEALKKGGAGKTEVPVVILTLFFSAIASCCAISL